MDIKDYFYSLGQFSGMHMFVIVSALIYNQYFNYALYILGLALNSFASEKFNSVQNVFFSLVYLYLTIHYFMPWTMIGLLLGGATIYERYTVQNHTSTKLISGALFGSGLAYLVVYVRDTYLLTSSFGKRTNI